MGWYDAAQVCLNGHMINHSLKKYPEFSKQYCNKCGAKTITSCPECNTPIQGEYHVEGIAVLGLSSPSPDSFCHSCGQPFPWTKARLDAAKEFTDMLEGISDEEKDKLKQSLNDLVSDTPRTANAATKWKRYLAKAGQVAAGGFKEVMYSIMVDTAKKSMWG